MSTNPMSCRYLELVRRFPLRPPGIYSTALDRTCPPDALALRRKASERLKTAIRCALNCIWAQWQQLQLFEEPAIKDNREWSSRIQATARFIWSVKLRHLADMSKLLDGVDAMLHSV